MKHFNSKIFIDGGLSQETKKAKEMLGFLDGQTTNPSLIAKNLKSRLASGGLAKLTQEMALDEYKTIVRQMSKVIPKGSVSIQVFANQETKKEEIIEQALARHTWIPNSSIKIPCVKEGLKAAQMLCQKIPLNITLVFSQAQAAAVYEATKKAKYPVFISPFVGRLDDRGECGMDVIENILKMYQEGDGHVEIITASVRSMDHLYYGLKLASHIITIPFKIFEVWAKENFKIPDESYVYPRANLKAIAYDADLTLGKPWESYDLSHELTDKGVTAFWNDWNALFQ